MILKSIEELVGPSGLINWIQIKVIWFGFQFEHQLILVKWKNLFSIPLKYWLTFN